MKKLLFLSLIVIIFSFNSNSQTLTLENDTGLPCHYVSIDVTASGFPTNVGALALYITIDGNIAQYISKVNGKISPLVNQSAYNQIGISWSNTNIIDINGVLFTMILHFDGGSTVMDWREDTSEVSLIDFSILTPTYVNGTLSEGSYTFNTWYVDASKPAGGNGLSWATAFNSIQTAANIPPKAGEQVLIKPGTYNEKVIIKSNAGYSVKPTPGVILSDTNKITFPGGANLSCVNLTTYPNQYYAYVYRSWNSNNGYYKVIEVNDAQNYIRVEGSAFIPETGESNNRGKVMAAVGRPVIYKKDPAASESQRVIVNAPSSTPASAIYIGLYLSETNADSCNWNIIEGIDINNTVSGMKGLQIHCSSYNTFAKGKIYCTGASNTGGIGVYVQGNSTGNKNARYNIIQNNEIYNTPYQGVLLGYTTNAAANNFSNFNQVIDNNFYLSGTSTLARFDNAVKVQSLNRSNVIEGNNFHDIGIYNAENGAVMIMTKADSTLVYKNIFRNIGKAPGNSGTNACIMMDSTINKVNAFNNIIYNDDTVTNAVYAFRIYGRRHVASKVCFNTIYKIDNAFYLQDNNANGAAIDFSIKNNIVSPTVTYFTQSGTAGRFTVTYNLFRLTPNAYWPGTGNIVGNPQFIEPDGSNMYGLILQPTSPAMYTGTAISGIARDYLGDSRSLTTPTMGAFENTMSCTWTGATSTNWHTSSNWNFLMVPQNYMGAIIPNVTNDPVVSANNAVCKSLKLLSGATIRVVSPRVITVNN